MKTIILPLILVFWMNTLHAQKVVKLDPVNVNYSSPEIVTTVNVDKLSFEVKEDYHHQFFNDPIRFLEDNFDYPALKLSGYGDVQVEFKNSKGHLRAIYNKDGELVRTSQRFEDILVSPAVGIELYKKHKGWTMISNRYTAKGKFNKIDKELYKITLVKGNDTRRIRIDPSILVMDGIAGN